MSSDKPPVLRLEDFRRVRERRRPRQQHQQSHAPELETYEAQIYQLQRENRSMAILAVTAYALGLVCGIIVALSVASG